MVTWHLLRNFWDPTIRTLFNRYKINMQLFASCRFCRFKIRHLVKSGDSQWGPWPLKFYGYRKENKIRNIQNIQNIITWGFPDFLSFLLQRPR